MLLAENPPSRIENYILDTKPAKLEQRLAAKAQQSVRQHEGEEGHASAQNIQEYALKSSEGRCQGW